MKAKYKVKDILKNHWEDFVSVYRNKLRPSIISNINKMLTCGSTVIGYNEYKCPNCSFSKKIAFTCKCRSCSSCGKKSIEMWLQKLMNVMPNTYWQHIALTMPSELWDFFWLNRHLLNKAMKLAAECILVIGDNKRRNTRSSLCST